MNKALIRNNNRQHNQLRTIKISYNVFGYAPGSVLFELGNTKILCTVTIATGVPPFLKGTKTGWLTAEYAMLPNSGHTRAIRESSQAKRNDRAVEISRLIGRSLRAVVDLSIIGERTIFVDCDVLQADGSTRTASITGACLALKMAIKNWLVTGELSRDILTEDVAAISVGITNNQPLLDLDYDEDSQIDADYNFVLTKSGSIIEIQGSAEKGTISWDQFEQLKALAIQGNKKLFNYIDESLVKQYSQQSSELTKLNNAPIFSLKNRLANAA